MRSAGDFPATLPRDVRAGCGVATQGMDAMGTDGGGPQDVVVGLGSTGGIRTFGLFAVQQFPEGVPGSIWSASGKFCGDEAAGGGVRGRCKFSRHKTSRRKTQEKRRDEREVPSDQ